jgi:hypothetical protein
MLRWSTVDGRFLENSQTLGKGRLLPFEHSLAVLNDGTLSFFAPRTSPSDQASAHRRWTSGNYSTQARLVTFADGIVVLEKSDGKTVSVPYAVLSPADQQFLDDWKRRN